MREGIEHQTRLPLRQVVDDDRSVVRTVPATTSSSVRPAHHDDGGAPS